MLLNIIINNRMMNELMNNQSLDGGYLMVPFLPAKSP